MSKPGESAERYVEVYDEPDHQTCLVNDYVHAYRVRLAPTRSTLWHRHCQDTVYFSLSNAVAGEQFPAADAVVTDVPCGVAVSRPHASEPLIHKVTNRGSDAFHLIGAEAHQRPAVMPPPLSRIDDHELVFETDRFRVYRVDAAAAREVEYASCGLLVALKSAQLNITGSAVLQAVTPGDLLWLMGPEKLSYPAGFSGFFAQWL